MSERGYNIIARAVGLLILLIASCMLAIQIPAVQNRLAKVAAARLESAFDGRLSWDDIRILAPNALMLRGATLVDDAPYTQDAYGRGFAPVDTLFHVGTLSATVSLRDLLGGGDKEGRKGRGSREAGGNVDRDLLGGGDKEGMPGRGGLHFGRVFVQDVTFNLVIEPGEEYSDNISRIFHLHSSGKRPAPGPDIFDIRKLKAKNLRYTMRSFKPHREAGQGSIATTVSGPEANQGSPAATLRSSECGPAAALSAKSGQGSIAVIPGSGPAATRSAEGHKSWIDFEDLDVTVLDLRGRDISFSGGVLRAEVDHVRAVEKSGYRILGLTGRCAVGQGKAEVNDVHLVDDWSDVSLNYYVMKFDNPRSFRAYTDSVRMIADLRRSSLDARSLSAFTEGLLNGMDLQLDITGGHFDGFVNDFDIQDLAFTEKGSGVSCASLSGRCIGLPIIDDMLLDAKLEALRFQTSQLDKLISAITPSASRASGAYGTVSHQTSQLASPATSAYGTVSHQTSQLASPATLAYGTVSHQTSQLASPVTPAYGTASSAQPQAGKASSASSPSAPTFARFAPQQSICLDGRIRGSLDNLVASINLTTSSAGAASVEGRLRNLLSQGRPMEIDADLESRGLDLGKVLQISSLGPVSLRSSASVVLPRNAAPQPGSLRSAASSNAAPQSGSLRSAASSNASPQVDIKSVELSELNAFGHAFCGISINGAFSGDGIGAEISSTDPSANLHITLDGTGSLDKGNACYRLGGDVRSLDLSALGIDTKGNVMVISGKLGGHLDSKGAGAMSGSATISEVKMSGDNGTADLDNLNATLETRGDKASLCLTSELLDANYEGSSELKTILKDFQLATVCRELSALYKPGKAPEGEYSGSEYNIAAVLHDPYNALQYILPKLYLSDSTTVSVNMDAEGRMYGRVAASRMAWAGSYLKDASIDLDNYQGLNLSLSSSSLKAGAVKMNAPALMAYAEDGDFCLQLHYDNMSGIGGAGELYLNGRLERDEDGELCLTANPLDSYINVENEIWEFGESEIVVKGKQVKVKEFVVSCGDQRLYIDGGISADSKDMLDVYMDDFNLAMIDEFLENKLGIEGLATGEAHIVSPTSTDIGMRLKFDCDKAALGGSRLGDLAVSGRWDNEDNSIRAFISNKLPDRAPLQASASYAVKQKTIDADILLDRFCPSPVAAVMPGVFSTIGGSISGHIKIGGSSEHPEISSEGTRLDSLSISLIPTGVTYVLNGEFLADSKGVHFPAVDVGDLAGGHGKVTGSLTFDHLRNLGLDMRLVISNMLAVDNPESAGQPFYGRLSASGDASIRGALSKLLIDANVRTSGLGDIHVPIKSSLIGNTSNLLTFREAQAPLDRYEEMMKEQQETKSKAAKGNIGIKARLGISPTVTAFAEIEGGNMVQAYGSGDIELELNPARNIFSLNGDYNVAGGMAKLNAAGVIGKDFSIKEGGSIKFGGDLMDTDLDLTAVHSLKTSLANLLSDSTAVASRKEVECGISISDKLRNPAISFSIDFPDLDPTTRAQVESMLNTEDKVQKQFVSLLLFGSFLPNELSGIVNGGGNTLLSNVSSIMSGQINSILQKLDIPVDLGLGYQQNQTGADIFDVAVSTQLFNDRVIVNGSFGNRQYKSTGATDMVGDVDVDIKVGKQGNFRINLFSHSADDYTSYLDYSQRSGAGLSYQREYNRLRELFRKKKKNSEPAEKPVEEHNMVIISIEEE